MSVGLCCETVDAPGWAEHISILSDVYCFNNSQPFNQSSLSSTITHLDCCAHCGSEEDVTELCLKDYPCLESIHIGSWAFNHILSVEVSHLPKLRQFVVEERCFIHFPTVVTENTCRIEDCPLLESVSIGFGSFIHYSALVLKGSELRGDLIARLAPSEVVVCGKRRDIRLFLESGVF